MMKRHELIKWTIIVLLILTLTLGVIAQITIILNRDTLETRIQAAVKEEVENLNIKDGKTPIKGIDYQDGVNGYTPIKNIDYFDGKKGEKGDKGDEGEKGDKGDTGDVGEKGDNGLTPEIQCNVIKNRWEIRYSSDSLWKILGATPVKCTTLVLPII